MTRSDNEQGLHHILPLRRISLSFDLHIFGIGEDNLTSNTSYDGETSLFVGTKDKNIGFYGYIGTWILQIYRCL